jgi:hypothetical protein
MRDGIYTPPHRTASPFQSPPLTPLTLEGITKSSVLSRAVAEEIRLLVPPRLQLADTWRLGYSLEEDGVSLATLYGKCATPTVARGSGFVLVVQDGTGGIFGAYLTDPPKPHSSFYGTGECFLWRASILPSSSLLSNLPPPPSALDTEGMGRSTTISSPHATSYPALLLSPKSATNGHDRTVEPSGTATPDSIRFKAFPYSGVNDYLIFCQQDFLSVGGGDGKYGLWLDVVLERGVSSHCMTFGNEGLSEEGEKFEVVGVEVWCVGG